VRFRDRVGIIKDIGGIFDACGVSIYSILQNPIEDPADAQYVIITDDVRPPHPEPMRARARALGSAPSVARALAGLRRLHQAGVRPNRGDRLVPGRDLLHARLVVVPQSCSRCFLGEK